GVAVRRVDRGHQHAAHRRLDVPGLPVGRIAGQGVAGDDGLRAARQDGDAVPAALPRPRRCIARRLELAGREGGVRTLQLLQADDVGPGFLEPGEQAREALDDVVDVEGGDPHAAIMPANLRTWRAPPALSFRATENT